MITTDWVLFMVFSIVLPLILFALLVLMKLQLAISVVLLLVFLLPFRANLLTPAFSKDSFFIAHSAAFLGYIRMLSWHIRIPHSHLRMYSKITSCIYKSCVCILLIFLPKSCRQDITCTFSPWQTLRKISLIGLGLYHFDTLYRFNSDAILPCRSGSITWDSWGTRIRCFSLLPWIQKHMDNWVLGTMKYGATNSLPTPDYISQTYYIAQNLKFSLDLLS